MAARLTPEATDAVPIWFVSPENWDEVRGAIGETSARFAAACGFEPKPGRLQLLPDASGGLAGALFGQAGANAAIATRSPRVSSRPRCRPATGASPIPLRTPNSRRSASCSGSIASTASRSTPRRSRASRRPPGSMVKTWSGSRPRSRSGATSSTRRPTSSVPPRSRAPRRNSRRRSTPASRRFGATNCSARTCR